MATLTNVLKEHWESKLNSILKGPKILAALRQLDDLEKELQLSSVNGQVYLLDSSK